MKSRKRKVQEVLNKKRLWERINETVSKAGKNIYFFGVCNPHTKERSYIIDGKYLTKKEVKKMYKNSNYKLIFFP